LTGEQSEQIRNYALDGRIPKEKLIVLGEIDPAMVYERILALTRSESHVIGIGNIAGERKYGAHIVNYFKNKAKQI